MTLQQLNIRASLSDVEFISDFLEEQGALAVTIEDGGEQGLFQEVLNETPLWKENELQGLFPAEIDLNSIILLLEKKLHKAFNHKISLLQEKNWVESTQQNFPALNFADKLWIVPSWNTDPVPFGTVVRLDPGLGFGTGTHPTTALCLLELLKHSLKNKCVIDYGCGSGILGLAAVALGARQVYAVDHDPQALIATRDNAELNQFSLSKIITTLPENLPSIQADIVLANILANPLCNLADKLIEFLNPGGIIVLSGFLSKDFERLLTVYEPRLTSINRTEREDWQCLVMQKSR